MNVAKKLIQLGISSLGYQLQKKRYLPQQRQDLNTMQEALERLSKHLPNPDVIIDGGSANGDWTQLAFSYWPKANYVLVDPLKSKYNIILPKNIHYRARYVDAVLGNTVGTIPFTISNDLYGSGVYGTQDGEQTLVHVPMITIAQLLQNDTTDASVLLKLDTHGYEMEIFEGVGNRWPQIKAIVVEVYGFYVSPTGVLFHQLLSFLHGKGFRLLDMVDIMRRKEDGAFWQCDAVFLKETHPVFQTNQYVL